MLEKKKSVLDSLHTPTWLFILLLFVLVLRIPSFFEPYYHESEMKYLITGEGIRQTAVLYSQVQADLPPLIYLFAAIAGSLFWLKAVLALTSFVTIFLFWRLSDVLFPKKENLQKISTATFALFTTMPLWGGNIISPNAFALAPTIASFLIIFRRKNNLQNLLAAGVLFAIATLFATSASLGILAVISFWLAVSKNLNKKTLLDIATKSAYLLAGFFLPILLIFTWFSLQGSSNQYLPVLFLKNPTDSSTIPMSLIFALGLIILFWKRKKLSSQFIFLTAWILFSLFAITRMGVNHPYSLIESTAPLALFIGMFFTLKNFEQALVLIPIGLFFFVPFYFKFGYYHTASYYQNFLKLIAGQESHEGYLAFFGKSVPVSYKIADFIVSSTKPDEKIFVWGDGLAIYALTRRLPATLDCYIDDKLEKERVVKSFKTNPPSFIVVFSDLTLSSELQFFLHRNCGLVESVDDAQIWKLLNPNLRTLLNSF